MHDIGPNLNDIDWHRGIAVRMPNAGGMLKLWGAIIELQNFGISAKCGRICMTHQKVKEIHTKCAYEKNEM